MDNSFGRKFINLIFNNGQIVALLFMFVVVAGSISFYYFQPQGFPTFTINMAVVTVKYPGATAAQVEDKLVKPIEVAIAEVKTVDEYTSTSNDSFAVVTVTFKDGANMSESIRDLNGKLANVVVPDGADKPEATEIDVQGPSSIVAVTLNDTTGTTTDWELYQKANIVRDKLETIQGVKEVTVMNPLTPEITVTFDNAKLTAMGIQRSQIEALLKAAQFEMPLGSYYDAQNDKYSLGIKKSLTDISQLENLVIAPNFKLKDIATITTQLNNNDYFNRVGRRTQDTDTIADAGDLNLQRAIVLSIKAKDKEDVIKLSERLQTAYDDLKVRSDLSPDLQITKVYDVADSTSAQLQEIKESVIGGKIQALGPWGVIGYLFGGITLVVLFLLIFVNWRVALLAGLSIPLAIGMTTAYLKMAGVSINTIVLFSMILVVGLVVDPTIVFLEAMQRYKEQGYTGREAAIKTFNTVGLGVLLSAMTNFLVFVPFGVVSGFFGQIIQYIPQTVIPAIVSSFIVPVIFFLPVTSSWLKAHKQVASDTNPELIGIWSLSKAIGNGVKNLLGKSAGKSIIRAAIILIAVVAPVAIGGLFVAGEKVKIVQFASTKDADMITVSGTVNDRWAFSKAVGVIDPVQKYLADQKEVEKFVVYQQNGNSFVLFVDLFPMLERQNEDLRTATDLVKDANDYFATIKNAEIEATVEGSGPPQEAYPVSIQLFDEDLTVLQKAADDVVAFLQKQDGVKKVENSLDLDGQNSGSLLVLDSQNLINLNPMLVAGAVRDQLTETKVTNIELNGESYQVVTKLNSQIQSLDDVKKLPVSTGSSSSSAFSFGQTAKPTVGSLITGTEDQKAQSLVRLNGKRYVEIKAKVNADTDPIKVQQELTKYLDKSKLESLGLDTESATETKGVTGSVTKSFTELFMALAIAMFLIYVLLVGFFRSILSPIIILFAVPLGFIGVFPAVALATGELGFLELLGVVAMAGIVVNVTILIIDFANQMRAQGMSAQEAIATSIAVRFKPILLTKMTIFAGLMPLALFSPFWRGLATVIVVGVIVSGFLSFITTPILYVWFDAMGKWFKPRPKDSVLMFTANPMQAEPMVSSEPEVPMMESHQVNPRAGLWGELPQNNDQSPITNNQREWDQ